MLAVQRAMSARNAISLLKPEKNQVKNLKFFFHKKIQFSSCGFR